MSEIIATDYILPNGRRLVGSKEEVIEILECESNRLKKQIEKVSIKVEQDEREYRKAHKKLWNY